MKLIALKKDDQNRAMLDPWTVVHFSVGLAAGLMDVRRDVAVSSAAVYEVVEQWVERRPWGQELFETSRPESVVNAAFDMAAFVVGHRLGELWNRNLGR